MQTCRHNVNLLSELKTNDVGGVKQNTHIYIYIYIPLQDALSAPYMATLRTQPKLLKRFVDRNAAMHAQRFVLFLAGDPTRTRVGGKNALSDSRKRKFYTSYTIVLAKLYRITYRTLLNYVLLG